jgi:hypothetical protein
MLPTFLSAGGPGSQPTSAAFELGAVGGTRPSRRSVAAAAAGGVLGKRARRGGSAAAAPAAADGDTVTITTGITGGGFGAGTYAMSVASGDTGDTTTHDVTSAPRRVRRMAALFTVVCQDTLHCRKSIYQAVRARAETTAWRRTLTLAVTAWSPQLMPGPGPSSLFTSSAVSSTRHLQLQQQGISQTNCVQTPTGQDRRDACRWLRNHL